MGWDSMDLRWDGMGFHGPPAVGWDGIPWTSGGMGWYSMDLRWDGMGFHGPPAVGWDGIPWTSGVINCTESSPLMTLVCFCRVRKRSGRGLHFRGRTPLGPACALQVHARCGPPWALGDSRSSRCHRSCSQRAQVLVGETAERTAASADVIAAECASAP